MYSPVLKIQLKYFRKIVLLIVQLPSFKYTVSKCEYSLNTLSLFFQIRFQNKCLNERSTDRTLQYQLFKQNGAIQDTQ